MSKAGNILKNTFFRYGTRLSILLVILGILASIEIRLIRVERSIRLLMRHSHKELAVLR